MTRLAAVALLLVLITTAPVSAGTVNATSCSRQHIQDAIDAAVDGDTVVVPAGSCTWTDTLTRSLTKSITLQGAGAISATTNGASTTGTDLTTITDNHPTSHHMLMAFTVATGKLLRITGFAFVRNGSSTVTQSGLIWVQGGTSSVRIDHNHFVGIADDSVSIHILDAATAQMTGVADHNYFDSPYGGNGPFAFYFQNDASNFGDTVWAEPDNFGSASFLFIEDNRFRNGYPGDSNGGVRRYVYRYNTLAFEGDTNKAGSYIAHHGVTNSRGRSARAVEYYGNVFTVPAPGRNEAPFPFNGGTALVWGNTVTQYRYVTQIDYTRQTNGTYNYGTPPSGWGNCNSTSGTVWDGGSGYPCMDQPGRGMGDLLSGDPISSTVNTRTSTQTWPQQALSPIYVWGNTLDPSDSYEGVAAIVYPSASVVQLNRDVYQQFGTYGESGTFDGTKGVGSGLLAARPSSGLVAGVGYWATDTQTLYVATNATTWSTYYTPYTYPHPLTAAASPLTSAPTNVRIR